MSEEKIVLCFVDVIDHSGAFSGQTFGWAFVRILFGTDERSASPADMAPLR
jgi:hypothetical protein